MTGPVSSNGCLLRHMLVLVLLCGCSGISGVVPSSEYDSYPSIMKELDSYGKCELGEGVFNVSQTIRLKSRQVLIGSGKHKTVLRLMDNCPSYTVLKPGVSYRVVSADTVDRVGIYVGHMTVDANLGGQDDGNHTNTINCVTLNGAGHVIDDVLAVGWGYGGQAVRYQECFPLLLQDGYSKNVPEGLTSEIKNCTVTKPCFDYRNDGKYVGGDASLIVIYNTHGPGIVANNVIADIGLSEVPGEGWSPGGNLFGITLYGRNVSALNNHVNNFYGTAFWVGDSWDNHSIVYRGNVCDRVAVGFRLNSGTWNGLDISGNYFCNYGDVPDSWRIQNEHPWFWNKSLQVGFVFGGKASVTNAVISNNTFVLTKGMHGNVSYLFYPPMIFTFEHTNYSKVIVNNNTILWDDGINKREPLMSVWHDSSMNDTNKVLFHNNLMPK